ncbi:MAG: cobalamin-dependent protein [Nanoarchaeota archaeon]|nr:cobalamin-dependent protein [Nanoarchaeota archaeon]
MRVLLIRPFIDLQSNEVPLVLYEPLGLEYLAAMADKEHVVQIYDCLSEKPNKFIKNDYLYRIGANLNDIREKILNFKPEAVGISALFFSQAPAIAEITKLIKELYPQIFTVIGGSYPSAFKEEVFKNDPNLDIVVIGEGEYVFADLLNNFWNLDKVKGIIYKSGNKIISNPPGNPILNLDSLPFPRRSLVKMQTYSRFAGPKENKRAIIKDFILRTPFLNKVYYKVNDRLGKNTRYPIASIITSRSCPNQCTFCAIHNLWGHKY